MILAFWGLYVAINVLYRTKKSVITCYSGLLMLRRRETSTQIVQVSNQLQILTKMVQVLIQVPISTQMGHILTQVQVQV
jgi:hypothetical protein